MKINPHFVKKYITESEPKISNEKQLWGLCGFLVIVGITAGFFYCSTPMISRIVSITLGGVLVWAMYLSEKYTYTSLHFYKGCLFVILSLFFFIIAFNLQTKTSSVNLYHFVLIPIAYFSLVYLNLKRILNRIKQGYINKMSKGSVGIFSGMFFLGLLLAKLGKSADQNISNSITIGLIVLLGLIFSLGTVNFLKYYFVKNGMDIDPNEQS